MADVLEDDLPVAKYTTRQGNKPQPSLCLYSLYCSVRILKVKNGTTRKQETHTDLLHSWICLSFSIYTVEPLLSGLRLTVNSINRDSQKNC
jgi:hypothetical protein